MDEVTFVKELEETFEVTLPQELKNFYEKKEYLKYEDLSTTKQLPNYTPESKFKVKFLNEYLWEEYDDWEIDREEYPTMIPLSPLDENDSQFLAIEIAKSNYPVYMFEHESGEFCPYFDSFQEFLKSLSK